MAERNNTFAVLLKPGEEQPAIGRAAQYAHFEPSIEVTAVRVVNNWRSGEENAVTNRVKADFEKLCRRYPAILNFKLKVIFSKDVPEAFVKEFHDGGYALAIISANRRNTIKDLFISTIDSSIMKTISIPLMVVKDEHSQSKLGRTILLAVDFEESSHLKILDEKLLGAAVKFAEHFNGEVHIVNCVSPVNRGLMAGDTSLSKIITGSGTMSRVGVHHRIVEEFAEEHNIPIAHTHVVEGRIDEEIPRLCEQLDARMVCMSSSPRSSFFGTVNSSACELVLEQIRGDVFIVTAEQQA